MPLFSRKRSSNVPPPRRRRSFDGAASEQRADRERQSALYRRGRTLAGSTYHTLKSAEPHALSNATPREKVHHLTQLRRKLSFVLSCSLVVILLLLVFLQQFSAGVDVQFRGSPRAVDTTPYEQAIQDYLAQNPLERLRFNMNREQLNNFVIDKLPEVERIEPAGYSRPVESRFDVTLRKPVVSWQVEDKLYFVDAHGVSFTKSVYPTPVVKIVDNSGVAHTSGTAIASARFLAFVGRAVALVEKNGLNVTQVAIPAGTSRQVALSLANKPYTVVMSIDRSAGEQVEDMVRTVQYFDTRGRAPQYIDLRVKGKAYYRE